MGGRQLVLAAAAAFAVFLTLGTPPTVRAAVPRATATETTTTTATTATADTTATVTDSTGPTVTATATTTVSTTATVTTTVTGSATVTVTPSAPATVTATATATAAPPKGDVYDTPGFHEVGGRRWMTVCEPYSVTVRCWTYIWGTSVQFHAGRFVELTGWVFNNLTYVASPRSMWVDNPLGNKGRWTDDQGRAWRTDCESTTTGGNGCRSYVETRVAERTATGTHRWVRKELFNNIVRFA